MSGLPAFRHLAYPPRATVAQIGAAGVQAILDGSDVAGWRPLLRAVQQDPWGCVAERVDRVLDHLESYGSAEAMRGWLRRCRAGTTEPAATLAALRREAGLTQRQLAARLGVSQAQVARVEVATAPSLGSLTRYLQALGLTPAALIAAAPDGARVVRLPARRTGP